ncbi:Zinc finger, C6HC-type [Corchorus capsularis]|uniref:RBR-type E3 ubiquitin transferase n=1 Tax=Corchorus capsularis TaxID=210143 RepID=A0A1R3IXF4_COCAP|nr:Zinc finger, C6HC-type [Corchorus capsularis]
MGCDVIAKWNEKIADPETRTMLRIMSCSKPCPNYKRPIEKNTGCMHMTCRPPCNYEFCWICLQKWSGHQNYYNCNRYSEVKVSRERSKESAKKYFHCCDRWEAHGLSRQKAVKNLEKLKSEEIMKLCYNQQLISSEVDFVVEAWRQIIECRQILRWTYAYRYFLSEKESGKVELFEFLQGAAESSLERLHSCTERGVGELLIADGPSLELFDEFWKKLIGLTGVTRNYFENLVKALQNGLSDVESKPASVSVPRMKYDQPKKARRRPRKDSS